MKTSNVEPHGQHAAGATRGSRSGVVAGAKGMIWRDAATESVGQIRDMTVVGATFTDNEDGTGVLDIGGAGGMGTPGWFNVKTYGAVGDGITDDTTTINVAIAAINAVDSGVLYFPAGWYIISGALDAITVPVLILGDGKAGFDGTSGGVSILECTSATANLFTASTDRATFRGLAFLNQSAVSAGSAIAVTLDDGLSSVDIEDCSFQGFYDGVSQQGTGWSIRDCWFTGEKRYGLRVRNTVIPDAGDWSISDCRFFANTYDSDAAIRIESSGGGKIVNCKINMSLDAKRWNHGIDLAVAAGVDSSVLLIANNSFENVIGNGINGTVGTGDSWKHIVITGNQFGLFSNTTGKSVSLVSTPASGFNDILIGPNSHVTGATPRTAMQFTKVDNIVIMPQVLEVFSGPYTATTCTNVHDFTTSSSGSVATDTIWDAKGDLAAGTGADTAAKLTVGADDTILMADAAQTTGLKWVAAGTPSAISTAAAVGTADTFTRGDHVHAHEAAHIAHDTLWDTAGDLAVATGADTAAKLAKGAAGANLSSFNGAVAWNGGTSFPGSPATGDRYWRSDGTTEYAYDGTRWISTAPMYLAMPIADALLPIAASTNSHRVGIPQAGTAIRIYTIFVPFFVSGGTALSASHKWVLLLKSAVSGTTISTITIDSGASNAWRSLSASPATNVALTEFELEINATKTGTPGSLYLTPILDVRIVNT